LAKSEKQSKEDGKNVFKKHTSLYFGCDLRIQ